jgi:transcriptional regulator with XRE-family HTH domain
MGLKREFINQLILMKEKSGLMQKDIAKLINVTPEAISMWKRGKRFPKPINIRRLSRVLGLNVVSGRPEAMEAKSA